MINWFCAHTSVNTCSCHHNLRRHKKVRIHRFSCLSKAVFSSPSPDCYSSWFLSTSGLTGIEEAAFPALLHSPSPGGREGAPCLESPCQAGVGAATPSHWHRSKPWEQRQTGAYRQNISFLKVVSANIGMGREASDFKGNQTWTFCLEMQSRMWEGKHCNRKCHKEKKALYLADRVILINY